MSCTNCFNGCVETTSDKCVKYTGNSIEFLGINTGDSLEAVEKAITDYLATVFNGEGIIPVVDPNNICSIVSDYLPCEECDNPTLVDILTAIIRSICDIEAEIVVERARIDAIEATYDTDCLVVDPDAGTHAVLEAAITALCTAIDDIATLNALLPLYVKIADINTYIQNYINSVTSNYMYTKMVPYVIYPFYPSATVMSGAFDINGVGLGIWDKVYLCNGYNGLTPDLRGRSLIGTTDMGGGAFDPVVDPGISGNPTYNLGTEQGANQIVLSAAQIAGHTHVATVTVNDPGHITQLAIGFSQQTDWYDDTGEVYSGLPVTRIEDVTGSAYNASIATGTIKAYTGLDGTNILVTNAANVGGTAHSNIHPVHACYYVMYIP